MSVALVTNHKQCFIKDLITADCDVKPMSLYSLILPSVLA